MVKSCTVARVLAVGSIDRRMDAGVLRVLGEDGAGVTAGMRNRLGG